MMIKETVAKYYFGGNYNCAETVMLVARDLYGIEISENTLHAIGAFGAGMGCGETCGALAGCVSALGCNYITTRCHDSEQIKDKTTNYVKTFIELHGSTRCQELKPKYFKEKVRCSQICEQAIELLETII